MAYVQRKVPFIGAPDTNPETKPFWDGCAAGKLLVRSDAADGIDSRHFGLIDACDVIGVARSAGYLPYSAAKRRISSCNS